MIISCIDCSRPAVMLGGRALPLASRLPYCRDHGPVKGTPLPRVTDGMARIVVAAWTLGPATKLAIANLAMAEESRAYAYRAIDRAIEAGLLQAVKAKRGYRVVTTRLGRAVIGQTQTAA